MSKQSNIKPIPTQVLQVYKTKSLKNDDITTSDLIFKVKPEKAKSSLLVTYKDLKKNFPYALINYYERKIKIKKQKQQQSKPINAEQPTIKNVKKSLLNSQKNHTHLLKSNQIGKNNQKINEIKDQKQIQNENKELICDYDQIKTKKCKFQVLLHQRQDPQNPYIKQLNQYQAYQFNQSQGYLHQTNLQNFRKRRKY